MSGFRNRPAVIWWRGVTIDFSRRAGSHEWRASMSNDQIHPRVQQLIDRQDILDCLMRYSRGVDRFDVDMIRSVYHPDATDEHGAFVGNPEQFVEWVLDLHGTGQISTQHQLTNHSCEIDGNTAHSETYFFF